MRVRGLLLTILTALKGWVCCFWFTALYFGPSNTHLLPLVVYAELVVE